MTTDSELFAAKLADAAFRAAFEAADAARRQKLLAEAGLHLPLAEAEAILSGELSEAELEKAAGGMAPTTDHNESLKPPRM